MCFALLIQLENSSKPDKANPWWMSTFEALCSCLLGDKDPRKMQKVMSIFNTEYAKLEQDSDNKKKKRCVSLGCS